jgi:tRNA(fMet)-specific endonuclease VapC
MAVLYLLDANICIYIAKHNPPAVRERALASINQLKAVIQVAPLSEAAGEHYGQIRAALQSSGQITGNNDLWLATHAHSEGWIFVTNNEREFVRVEGLQVENWAEHEGL